jgi:thiosulfate/3-mercaptopyruvate sulfurtransferase
MTLFNAVRSNRAHHRPYFGGLAAGSKSCEPGFVIEVCQELFSACPKPLVLSRIAPSLHGCFGPPTPQEFPDMIDPVISVQEARACHGRSGVVFLDATWSFPNGPTPRAEGFIPGAVPFDIDVVKDAENRLPHMLPMPSVFENHVREMGISNASALVVYDRMGLFSAARVWWMFHIMGHANVRVLNGGMPAWVTAGGDVTNSPGRAETIGDFTARFDTNMVTDMAGVSAAIDTGEHQILDARPVKRFDGTAPEPRDWLRSGHMPGAINIPFGELMNADGVLTDDLSALETRGVDMKKPIITSCGSGVTACILSLALARQGICSTVYDGSWMDWGGSPDTAITVES